MECAGCRLILTALTTGSTIEVSQATKIASHVKNFSGFQICFHGKVQVGNSNRLMVIRFIKSSVVSYQVRSLRLSAF